MTLAACLDRRDPRFLKHVQADVLSSKFISLFVPSILACLSR